VINLFKVENGKLVKAQARALSKESLIEEWVANDPGLLGLDAIIIGRQVSTDHGKCIDLLALDRTGSLIIIELKKDRTPRDIVAQVLDYGSWVRTLVTPQIYKLAERYQERDHQKHLEIVFKDKFGESIPERLNGSHSMLIVASELDPASRRIVEYLSEEHGVSINTAFFNVFEADGQEWLTTNFLLDQSEVEERSGRKIRPPWSGFYFVNAGIHEGRSWADLTRYGFIGACGGDRFTRQLGQLNEGDKLFAYHKGVGYIGYGIVTSSVVIAAEFKTENVLLFDQPLEQPNLKQNADDISKAEFVVGVDWQKTFEPQNAKTFKGAFANPNIVCKLRHPKTIDFLIQEFDVETN